MRKASFSQKKCFEDEVRGVLSLQTHRWHPMIRPWPRSKLTPPRSRSWIWQSLEFADQLHRPGPGTAHSCPLYEPRIHGLAIHPSVHIPAEPFTSHCAPCQQTMPTSDCSLSLRVIFSRGSVRANGGRPDRITIRSASVSTYVQYKFPQLFIPRCPYVSHPRGTKWLCSGFPLILAALGRCCVSLRNKPRLPCVDRRCPTYRAGLQAIKTALQNCL